MKKLLVILSFVFVSTSLFATGEGDFIKTKDGTKFFKKVKISLTSNFVGVKANGEKVKFNYEDVVAYSKSGEQYERMPVYKNNQAVDKNDFMKVVCYRNGMKLYEYEYKSEATGKQNRRYYVFKGERFVVEMDYANQATLSAFFDAK